MSLSDAREGIRTVAWSEHVLMRLEWRSYMVFRPLLG